jgi:hypothetical protein
VRDLRSLPADLRSLPAAFLQISAAFLQISAAFLQTIRTTHPHDTSAGLTADRIEAIRAARLYIYLRLCFSALLRRW